MQQITALTLHCCPKPTKPLQLIKFPANFDDNPFKIGRETSLWAIFFF